MFEVTEHEMAIYLAGYFSGSFDAVDAARTVGAFKKRDGFYIKKISDFYQRAMVDQLVESGIDALNCRILNEKVRQTVHEKMRAYESKNS